MLVDIISQSPTFVPALIALVAVVVAFMISRKWAGSPVRRKAMIGVGIAALAFVAILGFGLGLALVLDRHDMPSWLPDSVVIMMYDYARWAVSIINV